MELPVKPEIIAALAVFLAFGVAEYWRTNLFHKPGQQHKDGVVESVSTGTLLVLTQPFILLASALLMSFFFPGSEDILIDLPVIAQIGLLLVFDDMTQYWQHRITHKTPWLYNLHRPHHDAEYLSVRVVYRNNIFYYLVMPGIWCSGALIFMGLGKVYAVYLVVKLTVICAAHSDVRWDAPLYKIPWLSPVMWVVERTLSTPATHSAHHGKHQSDGITNYKGNYGNLLFFWDVLFGTAKITRKYPDEFGVENLEPVTAAQQLFWPLVQYEQQPEHTDHS